MYFEWKRGQETALSKHFHAKEFTCQCGVCEDQKIHQDLIIKLELLRSVIGKPLRVTSGYRCAAHQAHLLNTIPSDTVKNSQHVLGNAADIYFNDLDKLFEECQKIFKAVGDGRKKGFVHCDLRDDKVRIWLY